MAIVSDADPVAPASGSGATRNGLASLHTSGSAMPSSSQTRQVPFDWRFQTLKYAP